MDEHKNQETGTALQPLRSAPSPLSRGEVINGLSACLALVRPVGMSEDAATEWLAVAAAEVRHMPRALFEAGCREARQNCTHHGQILPSILKHKLPESYGMADKYLRDWERALEDFSKGYPALEYSGGPKRLGDVVKRITDQ